MHFLQLLPFTILHCSFHQVPITAGSCYIVELPILCTGEVGEEGSESCDEPAVVVSSKNKLSSFPERIL